MTSWTLHVIEDGPALITLGTVNLAELVILELCIRSEVRSWQRIPDHEFSLSNEDQTLAVEPPSEEV